MNNDLIRVLDAMFTTELMILLCLFVITVCVLIAISVKAYGILVLASGVIPLLLFYVYKYFNLWDVGLAAILYSRVAISWFLGSIVLSLWLMYRSIYDESNKVPPPS